MFKEHAIDTNLKIALLTTKHQFIKEQEQLISNTKHELLIDIIVATPGRLTDHLQKTKGFNVSQLRYLVLDECDRIMDQIKQNWLSTLFNLISNTRKLMHNECLNIYNLVLNKHNLISMQKILLSATLTRNPEILEQIKLFQPMFFNITNEKRVKIEDITENKTVNINNSVSIDKYNHLSVPNELSQLFIECSAFQKPLVIMYLIKTLNYNNILIFVKSIDTAKRLCKLFELNNIKAMEYSSSLHVERRKRILNKFETNQVSLLVCSDLIARGMDLLNVSYVVLYDSPKDLNGYIHRIGRTARAGRTGTSITLLEHKEIFFFKKMIKNLNQSTMTNESSKVIKEFKIPKSKLKSMINDYKITLEKLKTEIKKVNVNNNEISRKRKLKSNNENNNNETSRKKLKQKSTIKLNK